MTAATLTRTEITRIPDDDEIADAALASVLLAKPADDEVPMLVWWLVAEAIRTSVEVDDHAGPKLAEAELFTELALEELAEATTATAPMEPVPTAPTGHGRPGTRARDALLPTSYRLARQLVSPALGNPQRLRRALIRHRRALAHCRSA